MIVDSTVLISLGNIGKLDLLSECVIPEKVIKEVTKEPAKSALNSLKFRLIIPSTKSRRKALEILGDEEETGDSDVVAALIENPHYVVATDDRRIRNVCKALGGKVTGTLGIVIHSAKTGKIAKSEALEIVKQLDASGFRMSLELYEKVKEILDRI
ncbi:hypothetical protein DRP05_13245 [Archaeoglobales archaeon]|nr:MAG: hypothetical protein DRP05_13245 [Archaeoglobales archaeon]